MISKHIDLIAIGILLTAVALFSGAKEVVVLTMGGPVHYLRMDHGSQVKLPAMPEMPAMPRMPRIPLQRD